MTTVRQRGAVAVTAAAALAIGMIPAVFTTTSILASGEEPTTLDAGAVPAPKLVLATELNNSASVTLYSAAGGVLGSQSLSASNCVPASSQGEDLLVLTGAGNAKGNKVGPKEVGFLKGAFGVQDKGTGTSCGQVDAVSSESLTLALGSDALGDMGGQPLRLATAATLDLDLKGDAVVTATATGPNNYTGTFTLRSGTGTNTETEQWCSAGTDSGPDSGANDNCDWSIQLPDGSYFTTLVLKAITGSFGLSGGSDYSAANAGTHRSTIELYEDVDGVLACGAATITRSASEETPEVTVRRLDNADPGEDCAEIPYTLRNAPRGATFHKPLDSQTTAQFVADFVWSQPTNATTTSLATTQVDFEQGNGPIDIGWCPDPVYAGTTDVGGVTVPMLVGIASPLSQSDLDDTLDGVQFACVGVQTSSVIDDEPDTIKVVEQVYVLGDVIMRKP